VSHDLSALTSQEKRALLERILKEKSDQARQAPLTPGQRRLWQMQSLEASNPVYNISIAYELRGHLDTKALEQALRATVRRHESLRTRFQDSRGEPVQVALPELEIPLRHVDLRSFAEADRQRQANDLVLVEAGTPFELNRGPLARFTLLELSDSERVFQVATHHIISDRWSLSILARELSVFYSAFASGEEPSLARPSVQYADFSRWQENWLSHSILDEQVAYWKDKLRGPVPALALPTDLQPMIVPTWKGHRREFALTRELASQIKNHAVAAGATTYIVLLTGFAVLLHQYSLQQDMVICVPTAGRHRSQSRGIIGYFNNILAFRLDLKGNPTLHELTLGVEQTAREAFRHQDLPLQQIIELSDLSNSPMNRCLFSLQNTASLSLELPGIGSSYRDVPTGAADFDLAVFFEEAGDNLEGFIDYRTDRFSSAQIDQLLEQFQVTLKRLINHPDQKLEELPFYGPEPMRSRSGSGQAELGPRVTLPSEQSAAPTLGLPRNELERRLIAIWVDVLGVRNIDRNSNFFELGGHSLLAARLFSRIGNLLGRDLPLALLLRAPTIAELSTLFTQEGWNPSWSCLVPITPHGTKPPLFLVHAGGGNIISYRKLSGYLEADQPV